MRSSTSLLVAVLVLVGSLLSGCSGGEETVSGTVNKLDKSALPPNAVVSVELRDTSLQDVAAITLDTDVIALEGNQLPVPYELVYSDDDIEEGHTYSVFVRIEADDQLLYVSDTANPVITKGAPTVGVEVFVVPV
jgi:putative lipoprotein